MKWARWSPIAFLILAWATCGCSGAPERPADDGPRVVRFVHLPDLRLARTFRDGNGYRYDLSSAIFLDLLTAFSVEPRPDFVCFGGNQVENRDPGVSDLEEFLYLADNLAVPWYAVPGNREANPEPPGDPFEKETWLERLGEEAWIREGRSDWIAEPLEDLFVLNLDTARAGTESGALSEAQIDWAAQQLAARRTKPVIVQLHHPVLLPEGSDATPTKGAVALRDLLRRYGNVKLVLQGHLGRARLLWDGELPYLNSPSPTRWPHAVRELTWEGDAIRYRLVPWTGAEKEEAESKRRLRQAGLSPEAILGTAVDREGVLPVRPD